MVLEILIAMAMTSLILAVEHWFPWLGMIRRKLKLIERYIAGMLAVIVPLSVLFAIWGSWIELAAVWSITVTGGAVVVISYLVDGHIDRDQRANAAEKIEEILRDGTHE